MSELAGKEIPKDYRDIVNHQIEHLGWRYEKGGRHPKLYPADITKSPITLASTPSDYRAIKNFIAQIRRAGGQWPPEGKRR